jgi:predicted NBD/HSP70 family sugar kinase
MSRTDICAVAGLSQATVSAITTSLLAAGVLQEAVRKDTPRQGRGRPQVLLEPAPSAGLIAALALTMKGLAIALVDYSGRTLGHRHVRLQTLERETRDLIADIEAELRELISQHAGHKVPLRHIAIGVQGVTDSSHGRVLWSPILSERDVDFRDVLSAAFGAQVTIDNDCNMIAEALRWSPDFPFHNDFTALLLGNGIGMGLYLGGVRFHGTMSSAGEFGHMLFEPRGRKCRCGAQGCVEAYAGDYAIIGAARPELRDAAIRGNLPPETFLDLADAARNGDEAGIDAFRIAGEAIGSGLASLFSIIDPLPVAFVGDGAGALDLMEPTIRGILATSAVRNITSEFAFRSFPNETQLVLEGCSMTSLQYLDTEFFAHSPNADTILEHSE